MTFLNMCAVAERQRHHETNYSQVCDLFANGLRLICQLGAAVKVSIGMVNGISACMGVP